MSNFLGSVQVANRGYYLNLNLGAASGGNYTVSMVVNESHAIPESDYYNNSINRSYRWAGFDGIIAEKFEPSDGSYTVSPNTVKDFNFIVANLGTNNVSNVEVGYVVNATLKSTFSLDGTIPPGYAKTGTIGVKFAAPGRRNVGILVDPHYLISDPTRSDNLLTVDITVTDSHIVNRRNNVQVWQAQTDHGFDLLSFDLTWQETYSLSGSNVVFTSRDGYVAGFNLSRPSFQTPYTISVNGERHETSNGTLLRRFSMAPIDGIFPSEAIFMYSNGNIESVTYPKSNTNSSGFSVVITGNDITGPTSLPHFL